LLLLGENAQTLAAARQTVLAGQKEDGGWAQTDDMKSDAYATGQTLFILREVGIGSSDKAYISAACSSCSGHRSPTGLGLVKTRSRPIQTYF